MNELIEWLDQNGFVKDSSVKVSSKERFAFKNGPIFVTVGKRTTCILEMKNEKTESKRDFYTKYFESIIECIKGLTK